MTTKILIWMGCGLIVGSLINAFASEVAFIQDYLVNGLFHVVGALFISALKMLVVPLVTFSLICGVCGIGDVNTLGRVGIKAFLLFMLTTALAITLAITVAVVVAPGEGFDMQTAEHAEFTAPAAPPLTQVIIDLVPTNPIAAYADGNMLQIIFFTILFAICVLMVGERGRSIAQGAEKLNDVMMEVVNVVMLSADDQLLWCCRSGIGVTHDRHPDDTAETAGPCQSVNVPEKNAHSTNIRLQHLQLKCHHSGDTALRGETTGC